MKAPKIDLSKLEATIKVGDMLIADAKTELEKRFFTIINNFYRSCLTVKDEGKIIVSHSIYAPVELLYGFDNIFPLSYHMYSIIMTNRLEMHELIYGAASAIGVSPDICGGHISIPGVAVKGWIPKPDFILWDYGPCDNSAQAGEFLMNLFGVPGYFIDRPYRYVEEEITYYTRQYRELVRILEELAGRNIDWEKVKDRMRLTLEMAKVRKEFMDLRHAKPSPASVGVGVNHFLIAGLVAGSTEEGLEYYKMIRDEWANLVKQGKGYAPEKYRMLFVGLPDLYVDAFDNWMQLEHGISAVAGPTINFREDWEPDPSSIIDKQARPDPIKLLESLARSYRVNVWAGFDGPLAEDQWLIDAVESAKEYEVDGAIFWGARGCRMYPASLPTIRDAVKKAKPGMPTVLVDVDFNDPGFVATRDIQENVERFLEIVEESQ